MSRAFPRRHRAPSALAAAPLRGSTTGPPSQLVPVRRVASDLDPTDSIRLADAILDLSEPDLVLRQGPLPPAGHDA
jgi:hypothetical protein